MTLPLNNSTPAPKHALQHACSPGIDGLPVELALKVLQNLEQKDLRAFSQASRSSYDLALAAGLYIPRRVRWTFSWDNGFGSSLATLDRVLDHARDVRPAMNVAVSAEVYDPRSGEDPIPADVLQRLFASLARAFPYLIHLELCLPPVQSVAAVSAFLGAHGAPKLQSFKLYLSAGGIPDNLFNGDAPMLRTVSLCVADIGSLGAPAPIVALRNVTQLRLVLQSSTEYLRIAVPFPALQVLWIESSSHRKPTKIDLSGLRLPRLVLRGDDVRLTNTSGVQHVEHASARISSFWPAGCNEICARVQCPRYSDTSITFGPPDGSWRRTVALTKSDPNAALPLADAPLLSSNLVSLTLEKNLVNAFVQTPAELRGLRELLLDLTMTTGAGANRNAYYCWPPPHPRDLGLRVEFTDLPPALLRVRCPALSRIVIFALPSGRPGAVRPNKITRLAGALSLRDQQAALVLAGCTFFSEPAWPLFNRVFSSVEVVGPAGNEIPEYYHLCRYSGVFNAPDWLRHV